MRARRSSSEPGGEVKLDGCTAEQLRERAAAVGFAEGDLQGLVVEAVRGDDRVDVRGDDLMALPLDLVHLDPAGDLEAARRRARLRELARERHREAPSVCR